MISLAPFRYLNIDFKNGGVISKVEISRKYITFRRLGFQVKSYLIDTVNNNILYSNADGTGSDFFSRNALYKSYSESIERLAFRNTKEVSLAGFSLNGHSDGFAAFPGLYPSQTRKFSLSEAFERWSIQTWWRGYLNPSYFGQTDDYDYAVFYTSEFNQYCVLSWKKSEEGKYAYGFGGGGTLITAVLKSEIELKRNYDLLSKLQIKNNFSSIIEKRFNFFSSQKGFDEFNTRLFRVNKSQEKPLLAIDTHIKGSWTKYAYVWRCLFYSDWKDTDEDEQFFLF